MYQDMTSQCGERPLFALSDAGAFGTRVEAAAIGTALDLLDRLNTHHPATVIHSVRVARLTMAMWNIAPTLLGPYPTVLLAGLLHDAGKLYVPQEILSAERRLTDAEFAVMREHSRQGAVLLEQLGFTEAVVAAARDHHERWSGGGYPTGRPSRLMSPLSCAVAAADAFSAMIEAERGYRRSRGVGEGLAEMRACSGTQFDPTAVELLHAAVEARNELPCLPASSIDAAEGSAQPAAGLAAMRQHAMAAM